MEEAKAGSVKRTKSKEKRLLRIGISLWSPIKVKGKIGVCELGFS